MTTPTVPALPGMTPLGLAPALDEGEHFGSCDNCGANTIIVFTPFGEDDAMNMCASTYGCRNTADEWRRASRG